MNEFKLTPEIIKERMAIIDRLLSTSGMCKDDWEEYEMPKYEDAEELNEEEWQELMEHASYIKSRCR